MRHLTVTENRKKALKVLALCLTILGIAVVAYASEGGGGAHGGEAGGHGGAQLKDFIWRVIDFSVLAAIIIWALVKQNVKGGLKARQDSIENALREAAEARDAAERKLQEYTAKLESANREIDELSGAIPKDAEQEKVRIIAEANAMAEKIKEQARQTAVQEIQKARTILRQEAARLAVELAETKIRDNITKSDQDRLVGDYLSKVVELH
jgi:F-type H+-transporting ATPase subunit b